MKLKLLNEKVFEKDLDGDMKAEVPPDREGETGAPEVHADGGLSDADNNGRTDNPSSKKPMEIPDGEAEPMDSLDQQMPGDDELVDALDSLEEDKDSKIKLKISNRKP